MIIVSYAFIAFVLFASMALGAATAWLVVWKSKKPILWVLAVPFALFWLIFAAGPLIGLGFYLPYRARAVAPVMVAPVPSPSPTPSPAEPLPQDDSEADSATVRGIHHD